MNIETTELKTAIHEVLDERNSIDKEKHTVHHRYVDELITCQKKKREARERIKQQVMGWGIITALSGIGFGAYHLAVEWLKKVTH